MSWVRVVAAPAEGPRREFARQVVAAGQPVPSPSKSKKSDATSYKNTGCFTTPIPRSSIRSAMACPSKRSMVMAPFLYEDSSASFVKRLVVMNTPWSKSP